MAASTANFDVRQAIQAALAAHQRGDLSLAAEQYRRILSARPQHADATHFLGLLEHQQGHAQVALTLLHRAIDLSPANPLYQHNLAGVYKEMGNYPEAKQHYRHALALDPHYVDSYIGLAAVLITQGEHALALENSEHALALSPENFAALEKMGEALHGLGRDSEAVQVYRRLEQTPLKDAKSMHVVGMALHAAGANAEALHCLRAAIKLGPDAAETYNSLGIVLGDAGDLAGAEANYRTALHINPSATGALHNLVNLVHLNPGDPLWQPTIELAERATTLTPDDAIPLHFALGTLWDQRGDYEKAFGYFLEGNRQKRARTDYDENRQAHFYQSCRQILYPNTVPEALLDRPVPSSTFTPVFIVGFSRSGTTLIEQILASHPQVHGAGETQQLWCAVRAELHISSRNDDDVPVLLMNRDPTALQRIAYSYQAALTQLAPTARYVTDKLSGNAALIGLIHAALPGARIIHCTREPLDTCTSCFSKLFTSGHLFSYELGELGRFYRLYESLMEYWSQSLPAGRILEVRYENLVSDLEGQTRRLLRYCDLDWNPKCLRFYETQRSIRTASLAQVHQPIYANSIGRWHHYEQYLDPLKQALAQ